MTEQDWLACDNPAKMLKRARFRSYRRKSRLFAVACCRCIWDSMVDERSRVAVEVAERHADGVATDEELRIASEAAHKAHREMFDTVGKVGACIEWAAAYAAAANPFHAAKNVTWMAATPRAIEVTRSRRNEWDDICLFPCTVTRRSRPLAVLRGKWKVARLDGGVPTGAEKHIQGALLRDIFGPLPFRSVAIGPDILRWHEKTVSQLARTIYDERRFTDLPILADALEEAGSTDEEILSHCRGPGPHVRGCWAVDLLLGKE